jgi:hypothetical protein
MKRVLPILIATTFALNVAAQQTGSFENPRDGKTYETIDLTKLSTSNFAFVPQIKAAKVKRAYQIGSYFAFLYSNIESIGTKQYPYILAIVKTGENGPCLLISSEVTILPDYPFLCTFTYTGHYNMGASNDWTDLELFTAKALSIAVEHFEISDSIQELPLIH